MARAQLKVSVPGINVEALSEDNSSNDILRKGGAGTLDTLRQAGWASGHSNAPAQGVSEFDETERGIINSFQTHLNQFQERGYDILVEIVRVIDEQASRCIDPDFQQFERDTRTRIVKLKQKMLQPLQDAYAAERRSFRDLQYFKARNNLRREPSYPDSHIFTFAILLAILMAESFANSYFFAQGSELGLLGGWIQAFLVSMVNVFVPFLAGLLILRHLQTHSHIVKVFAMAGTGLFGILIFTFNLGAAHYRDLLESMGYTAHTQIVERIQANPFGLQSFDSYMLLLIGLAISALSTYKGFYFDDPFPGYGKRHRQYESRRKQFVKLRDDLNGQLNDLIDRDMSELENRMQSHSSEIAKLSKYHADFENIRGFILDRSKRFQEWMHQALEIYRSANREVRTVPEPATFRVFPELRSIRDLPPLNNRRKQLLDRIQNELNDRQKELNSLRERIHQIVIAEAESINDWLEERILTPMEERLERERAQEGAIARDEGFVRDEQTYAARRIVPAVNEQGSQISAGRKTKSGQAGLNGNLNEKDDHQ